MKKMSFLMFAFLAVMVLGLTQPSMATSYNRVNYNVVVASGSNSLVGTVAVQLENTDTAGYTKAVIWEDTGTCDMTIYLGDTSDNYFTVLAGNRETLDFRPPDKSNGYYVKTTATAGTKINFIGTKQK